MANARTRRTILDILATDATWQRVGLRGDEVWQGKCLSCSRKLVVALDGTPVSRVTIEHIVPKHHGGTDDLANLGLTCARCNHGKGARHDRRPLSDPTLQRVITHLQDQRRARWRGGQRPVGTPAVVVLLTAPPGAPRPTLRAALTRQG